MLLTSLNKSVVKGHQFTIASTWISKVCNDLSFRLVPWVFNKEVKIVLALLICLSHTPSILLAEGGFCFHSIHSPPLSLMKSSVFCWSISARAFLNFCESETSVSMWMALLDKHVNKAPALCYKWPKQVYTTICKRRFLTQSITWERCHLLLLEVFSEMSACDTLQNIKSQSSILIYDPETRRSDVVHCNASSRVFYLLMAPSDVHYSNSVFLTHVGIRQMPTWLPTWKAKSLYHVSSFLPTWFFCHFKSSK